MKRLAKLIQLGLYLALAVVLAPFVWDPNRDGVEMTDSHPQLDPAKTGPVARKVYGLTNIPGAQATNMKRARQANLLRDLQAEAERRGWSLWQIRGSLILQRKGFRDRKFPGLHAAQVAVYNLKEPKR